MSVSLSRWLALRESADAAARSADLTKKVIEHLPRDRPLSILDLGSGTGSNVRYLARYLPQDQEWLVVDADGALLDEARTRIASWADRRGVTLRLETQPMNLGAGDSPASNIYDAAANDTRIARSRSLLLILGPDRRGKEDERSDNTE